MKNPESIPISPSSTVKGVKITCHGDQMLHHYAPWHAVDIPRDHQIFQSPQVNQISTLLGIPILTRKCPPERAWKEIKLYTDPYENVQATFLHLDTDPKSPRWGWAPPQWQNKAGSVIVVRQDGKDITPRQVEVLCDFCYRRLQSLFESSLETGDKERVLKNLTKEAFAAFFEQYKNELVQLDPSWASERVPSAME